MAEAVEAMGRVDGVIANAGLMSNERTFVEMSSDAWHGLLAVNQHGAFFTMREAARHMKRRYDAGDPGGSLLFCASLSALTGSPGMEHYNASKGAMVAMSRGIAVEGGRYGIRSNVVCPGFTLSETVDLPDDHPVAEHFTQYNPMSEQVPPSDFEGIGGLLHERPVELSHRRRRDHRGRLDGQRRARPTSRRSPNGREPRARAARPAGPRAGSQTRSCGSKACARTRARPRSAPRSRRPRRSRST